MAIETILASVGTLTFFDKSSKDIIATANALTQNNIDITSTIDQIRAGTGNAVQGVFVHDTAFNVQAESATFKLDYMALNCGGQISANGDSIITETITTSVANTITVTNTPIALTGEGSTVYGWYKLQSDTSNTWTTITFSGKNATVGDLPQGTTVCVKYLYSKTAIRQFKVAGNFVPSIVHAVLTIPLYASGATGVSTNSAQVGQLVIDIPNYSFNGSQSYSLNASGTSTAPLNGTALLTYGGGSCDDKGYYAIVNEEIYNLDPYADVRALVVADSDIDLVVDETQVLKVLAVYNGLTSNRVVDNSELTFTSSATAVAEVSSAGVVTAKSVGTATIEITKGTFVATARVTVTAE